MSFNWIWLLSGIIPCWAKWQREKDESFIQIRTLLWQFALRQRTGFWSLELTCIFIQWCRRQL
jgi:hypothetical protein